MGMVGWGGNLRTKSNVRRKPSMEGGREGRGGYLIFGIRLSAIYL